MKSITRKKKTTGLKKRESLTGYLFVSPWIIGALMFLIIPLGQSFYYSLCNVKVSPKGRRYDFVDFKNYTDLFRLDVGFIENMLRYLLNTLISVPVIVVFALIIAMLLNNRMKGKGFFRTIYFLPVIVVSGPVMIQLADQGATSIPAMNVSGITRVLSTYLPRFMVEPIANLFNNMILILWYSGVQILIFLAVLQKIDNSLYEAAKIDGGSAWECFWKITLPIIKPMILLTTIYTVIYVSGNEQNVIINSIYNDMFAVNRGYGFASAKAWLYSVVVVAIVAFFTVVLRNRDTYQAEIKRFEKMEAKKEKERRKLLKRQTRRSGKWVVGVFRK
ncbi:MAG: sugar ABC transporter permease [Clostridiaceae bacterium]|nr:sugar ABC transporter permease [Clostridiaceae bacterium]